MYIQVLSFHHSASDREASTKFVESAVLGLAEFDGYLTDTCLTRPGYSPTGGMIAWSDWKSLESFRRSELYAKLLMSPHFEEVDDRAFYVDDRETPATGQLDLLSVA